MNAPAEYKSAATQPKQLTTHQLLQKLTPEIGRALPKGMDPDRIARLVMTEIRKSQNARGATDLTQCTQESFAGALLTASALGLEPGVMGECYLVPYRDKRRNVVECQLIIGYQGIVKLFWQHELAAGITAEWVGANDTFRFSKGLNPILEHEQAPQGERGEPIYYYAIVRIKGREPLWDVFSPAEIKRLRRGKEGSSGDIDDPMHWMERKTALKQVLKLAPKSTRLDLAIRSDEAMGSQLSGATAQLAITEAPDYIEGEFDEAAGAAADEVAAVEPPADVVYASKEQIAKLANIRKAEGHDGPSWAAFVSSVPGAQIIAYESDAKLTFAQAQAVIDVFNTEAAK